MVQTLLQSLAKDMEDASDDGKSFNLIVSTMPDGIKGTLRYELDRLGPLLFPNEALKEDLEQSLEFIENDSVIIKVIFDWQ
eukprot:5974523-Pyramimonas_sp.AAC.1